MFSFLLATGRLFFTQGSRLLTRKNDSIASSDIATSAVRHGACKITHLFNAMPQLHHRDPTIIGLLGASPHVSSPPTRPALKLASGSGPSAPAQNAGVAHEEQTGHAEAIDTTETPPQTPLYSLSVATTMSSSDIETSLSLPSKKGSRTELHVEEGDVAEVAFVRPFYGMIVDGIHSHPNSVRVGLF